MASILLVVPAAAVPAAGAARSVIGSTSWQPALASRRPTP
jgi:hypothetical protein